MQTFSNDLTLTLCLPGLLHSEIEELRLLLDRVSDDDCREICEEMDLCRVKKLVRQRNWNYMIPNND